MLEIQIYKDVTRFYVHHHNPVRTQQFGARRILTELFRIYFEAFKSDRNLGVLPEGYKELRDKTFNSERELINLAPQREDWNPNELDAICARMAADYICRMTEDEVQHMCNRLTGVDLGSIFDSREIN